MSSSIIKKQRNHQENPKLKQKKVFFNLSKKFHQIPSKSMNKTLNPPNQTKREEKPLERSKTFTNLPKSKKPTKYLQYGAPEKRQSLLNKIKTRINKIADSNLNFYKIKEKEEKSLKSYLKVLKKDQSYKRKVQSKVFVNMLINQHHGDAVKMRKRTESQRRNYYLRKNFKKCVDFYMSIFSDLSSLIPIMVNGLLVVKEVVEYLRIVLEEGEVFLLEDFEKISDFVAKIRERDMKVNFEVIKGRDEDGGGEFDFSKLEFFFLI